MASCKENDENPMTLDTFERTAKQIIRSNSKDTFVLHSFKNGAEISIGKDSIGLSVPYFPRFKIPGDYIWFPIVQSDGANK